MGDLFLGPGIDAEANGQPTINADGDDTSGIDDEDGVTRTPGVNWQVGGNGSVDVTVTGGTGCLSGWIDWDGNGIFGAGEDVIPNVLATAGAHTYTFSMPVAPSTAPVLLPVPSIPAGFRSRLHRRQSESDGGAANGEVEDYHWSFGPNAVSVRSFGGSADASDLACRRNVIERRRWAC